MKLTPRGGGSSTAGGCLGRDGVISLAKRDFLSSIGELQFIQSSQGSQAHLRVGAGVVHARLQSFLKEKGYHLPADPSSAKLCCIGGNVATKASGPHAFRHGSIARYVKDLSFLTPRGELVDTSRPSSIPSYISKGLDDLRRAIRADPLAHQRLSERKGRKIASGYNLFPFLEDWEIPRLLARVLVGSVGTLGIVLSVDLFVEKEERDRTSLLLCFDSLFEAGEAVSCLREVDDVAAIEIVNASSLKVVAQRRGEDALAKLGGHVLLVDFAGDDCRAAISEVEKRLEGVSRSSLSLSPEEETKVWALRKALMPTFARFSKHERALSLVNDIGVDPAYLAQFISDVEKIFHRHGLLAAIYGHAGNGNLHLRPVFDLQSPDLAKTMERLSKEVYEACFRYDGTITAEHGMGPLRAPFLEAEWGRELIGHMKSLKKLFDGDDFFNPEAMFTKKGLLDDMAPELC